MRRIAEKMAPVLRLTRVTTAFAAVANVWFVILWTRASALEGGHAALGEVHLALLLPGGALAAVGLYAFGAALNDFIDASRDRALARPRPVATGRASTETTLIAVAGSLIAAVLGATVFGTRAVIVTVVLAAVILGFNAAGRFVPAVGLFMLCVIYAGHMLVPNLSLKFLAPVWMGMTHATAVAGVRHWLGRKSPPISRRAFVGAALGWAACSIALLALAWRRTDGAVWPEWVPAAAAVWPAVLAAIFVALTVRRISSLGVGPRAADKVARYGALWMSLYACAWLFGAGHTRAAALMGGLSLAGFVGMTVLRESYGLLEHPVGYRR